MLACVHACKCMYVIYFTLKLKDINSTFEPSVIFSSVVNLHWVRVL